MGVVQAGHVLPRGFAFRQLPIDHRMEFRVPIPTDDPAHVVAHIGAHPILLTARPRLEGGEPLFGRHFGGCRVPRRDEVGCIILIAGQGVRCPRAKSRGVHRAARARIDGLCHFEKVPVPFEEDVRGLQCVAVGVLQDRPAQRIEAGVVVAFDEALEGRLLRQNHQSVVQAQGLIRACRIRPFDPVLDEIGEGDRKAAGVRKDDHVRIGHGFIGFVSMGHVFALRVEHFAPGPRALDGHEAYLARAQMNMQGRRKLSSFAERGTG